MKFIYSDVSTNWYRIATMSSLETLFENVGIDKKLLPILSKSGIVNPTEIQESTIPLLIDNKDIIAQSNTGTGKTLAYGIPIIHKIEERYSDIQGLVIVPTRELADQVTGDLRNISEYKKVKIVRVCGGKSFSIQAQAVKRNPHVVVATPGRLIDFIRKRIINLDWIKFLIIDEADMMLEMGFINDIEFIVESIKNEHQTALFSATFPKEIISLSKKYQKNSIKVLINQDNKISEKQLMQYYYFTQKNKGDALSELIDNINPKKAIIFCRTKHESHHVYTAIREKKIGVVLINGDMSQKQRDRSLGKFKEKNTKIIVATDLLSRGIHVEKIDYILNYNVPKTRETYFHRIGRTARIDSRGKAITLISERDRVGFYRLREQLKCKVDPFEGSDNIDEKLNKWKSTDKREKFNQRRNDEKKRRHDNKSKGENYSSNKRARSGARGPFKKRGRGKPRYRRTM